MPAQQAACSLSPPAARQPQHARLPTPSRPRLPRSSHSRVQTPPTCAYSGTIVSACCTAVFAAISSSSPTHVSITNTYDGGDSAPWRGRLAVGAGEGDAGLGLVGLLSWRRRRCCMQPSSSQTVGCCTLTRGVGGSPLLRRPAPLSCCGWCSPVLNGAVLREQLCWHRRLADACTAHRGTRAGLQ